jgi:hypothetical protein
MYYRMDAVRSDGTSFNWPSDILSALQLSSTDVGIVATIRTQAEGAIRDVYLPLTWPGQQAPSGARGAYQLIVVPGVELKEVFLSLSRSGERRGKPVMENRPLGYGYYPAERAFAVPVLGMRERGIYHLELAATFREGGSATTELWFYHPGD